MEVGDLVSLKMKKTQPPQLPRHGIIIKTWRNHKGNLLEIEVMWEGGQVGQTFRADLFEVVNESR